MNIIFLLLIVEIFLFWLAFVFNQNDIMAPSVIMCIMFLISTLFAILNIRKWQINYTLSAFGLLSSGILTFILSETLFRYIFCNQLQVPKQHKRYYVFRPYQVKNWKLNFLVLFNIVVCVIYYYQIKSNIGSSAQNMSEYFHMNRVIGINNMKYDQSVSLGGMINQFLKLVSASGYVCVYLILDNILCTPKMNRMQIKLLFVIIISLFPSVMGGGRTGFLRIISAVLIDYYILWHQKNGWLKNASWKFIKIGIFCIIAGIPLFYYSLALLGRTSGKSMIDHISVYIGSSIQLFNLYVDAPISTKSFGEETLVSLSKALAFLGIGKKSNSYNLEFRTSGTMHSNVYTFFRRPLHDFGILGMYMFVAVIACFFSWIYNKKIKYKPRDSNVSWVLIYGYLFYWIISSSIIQYSGNYISVGTLITISLMIILFKVMVNEQKLFTIGKKKKFKL